MIRSLCIGIALFLGAAIACQAGGVRVGGNLPGSLEPIAGAWERNNARVETLCLDGERSWMAIVDGRVMRDGPGPDSLFNYLDGLLATGPPPRSVCFHGQGWVVVKSNGTLKWEGLPLPPVVDQHIQGAVDNGAALLSVSYTKNAWVVVTDRSVQTGGDIPRNMQNALNEFRQNGVPIRSASIAPNGTWSINLR